MLRPHYEALRTRLETLADPAAPDTLAFTQVAWYNQQYQDAESGGVPAPCAYLEFQPAELQSRRGGGGQQADLTFRVHVVGANHSATDAQALSHLDVVQAVRDGLRGWSVDGLLNSITVRSIAPDHAQTSLVVTILTCTTLATFAAPARPVVAAPTISLIALP